MINSEAMQTAILSDADLVAESLGGDREAFGQIVERYQTLISSLAYSATGNLSQSEDLAQETFVTAWKRLAELREPAKLRAWLCGIARFLVSKEFRRQGREPVHAAESLEAVAEWVSPAPATLDHVISEEEKAILWRSLERIPELYREPLVLYYREHQSIAAVAHSLDLSEDAVKQRLSRGRKLLQEQVLAFIAAALAGTKPDKAFTLGVLGALPLVATTAKAVATTAAIKGGSTFKLTTGLALLGAVLTADVLFQFSLFAFMAFTGACLGFIMGRACGRSPAQLQHVTRFWRALAVGYAAFLVLPYLATFCFQLPSTSYPGLWRGLTWWLGVFLAGLPVILATWLWRWWRGLQGPELTPDQPVQSLRRQCVLWLALGMIVPAGFLGVALSAMALHPGPNWTTRFISEAQVQTIIAERQDATFTIQENRSGSKFLWIKLPETRSREEAMLTLLAENQIATVSVMGISTNGPKTLWMRLPERSRRVEFLIPTDESMLAQLAGSGRAYSTTVEGRDFDPLGLPGKLVQLLCFFLAPMGAVVLLRRPWRQGFQVQESEIRRDERSSKMALKALAVAMALVLITLAGSLGVMVRWQARTLAADDVRKMAADLKANGVLLRVYQYSNGDTELCFPPNCVAPADAATLAILRENGLSYITLIQGRDFGFGSPQPAVALLCISILLGGAGVMLWRVSPRALAAVVALLLVAAVIPLSLMTSWRTSDFSPSAARQFILEHPRAHYAIFQFADGSREIGFGERSDFEFTAPADDATVALLAERHIAFRASMQGRDFGYRGLTRGVALLSISGLLAGAAGVSWLAWKRRPGQTSALP